MTTPGRHPALDPRRLPWRASIEPVYARAGGARGRAAGLCRAADNYADLAVMRRRAVVGLLTCDGGAARAPSLREPTST
jgi:hypothetical protein